MDQLRALRTFIAVAEHSSFAEAARRLRSHPGSVSRIIASLETALGMSLLVRTTRSVRLTEDGTVFLERCRAGIAEIDGAFAAVRSGALAPRGTITITAPVMFGRIHIVPVVVELIQLYPDLNVRLLLLDRVVRLVEEGIDVAVRIADPADSAMRMLKIGEVRRVFSASPGYLRDHGEPMKPEDLRQHQLISVEEMAGLRGSSDAEQAGYKAGVPRLSVNSVEAAIDAAVAGLGVVETLSYQVEDRLRTGALQQILMTRSISATPVVLLFQGGRRDTPGIRAFADLVRQRLRGSSL